MTAPVKFISRFLMEIYVSSRGYFPQKQLFHSAWLYGLLQNQTFFFWGREEKNLHKKVKNWDRCLRSKMKWTAVSFI